MKIIGIGGTNGSGKDFLSEILAAENGWLFIAVSRDLIIPELIRRGLPLERENMAALTAEWNREISPGAVIGKAVDKFRHESLTHNLGGLLISSIRHPREADRVHALGGRIVWLDADPHIRYNRIYKRSQGDKDKKTFEQFLAEEQAEMSHRGDEATLNMAAVKAKADIFINNDSDDIEVFKKDAQKALAGLI